MKNNNISVLQDEEAKLLKLLSKNREKQREILARDFFDRYGVEIGDKVSFSYGRDNFIGVVSRLEHSGVKPQRLWVLLLKQDGTVGKKETRIWNIESMKKIG